MHLSWVFWTGWSSYTRIECSVCSIAFPRDIALLKRCETCYLRETTWKYLSKTTDGTWPLGKLLILIESFPRHKRRREWERDREKESVIAAGEDAKMVQHLLESGRVFLEKNVIPIVTLHLLWQSSFSLSSACFLFFRRATYLRVIREIGTVSSNDAFCTSTKNSWGIP